jgi:ribosomal protein S13
MTTVLGDKLNQAFEAKNNDVETFLWKGSRKIVDGERIQSSMKMVDMTEEELHKAYKHCESMLYSDNYENPGRRVLLEQIEDQRTRCNAELFLIWLLYPGEGSTRQGIVRTSFFNMLNQQITAQAEQFAKENAESGEGETNVSAIAETLFKEWTLNDIMNSDEDSFTMFASLPLYIVREACLSALGKCARKHITLTFITELGLWFTRSELLELNKKDENGRLVDRIKQVAELLNIKLRDPKNPEDRKGLVLKIDDRKGLTLKEFSAMLTFRKDKYDKRYNDLTKVQLETLRDKVLLHLENKVRWQASEWEKRIKQIKAVADYNGYKLSD